MTQMIAPNGTLLTLTPDAGEADPPTSGSPTKAAHFGPGVPMKAVWAYNSTFGRHYRITLKDQTTWIYQETYAGANQSILGPTSSYFYIYYPTAILDRFGNELDLTWAPVTFADPDPVSGQTTMPALTGFYNSSGVIMTITYTSTGRIDHVTQIPPKPSEVGRAIYYKVETMNTGNVPAGTPGNPSPFPQHLDILTKVSFPRAVTTDAHGNLTIDSWSPGSDERYDYGYMDFNNGEIGQDGMTSETVPYLHTISVPSGYTTQDASAWNGGWNGARAVTTLNYGSDGSVASVTDQNGYVASFSPVLNNDGNAVATRVIVADGNGVMASAYYAYFNAQMESLQNVGVVSNYGSTSEVDFAPVSSTSYASASDPYGPSSITDANGRTLNMTWDGYGNLVSSTSPKGVVSTTQYDPTFFGQETNVAVGSLTPTQTHYNTGTGTVSEIDAPIPYQNGVGSGSTQATTFDAYTALGNPQGVIEPGNSTAASRHTTLGYGTDGFTERLGLPTVITDAAGHYESYSYDSRGNRTIVTDRDLNETQYTYNLANQVTRVDWPATGQNGASHAYTLNTYLYPGGPLTVSVTYPESGANPASKHVTMLGLENEAITEIGTSEYQTVFYDASYRPVSVHSGTPTNLPSTSSPGTQFVYDLSGRVIRMKGPNASADTGGSVTKNYRYDAVGNVLTALDGRGFQKNYTYGDADGLLTHVAYTYQGTLYHDPSGAFSMGNGSVATNATTGEPYDVSMSYDSYDRVHEVADGVGDATWTYDDLGDVLLESRTLSDLSGPSYSVGHQYNADGSPYSKAIGGSAPGMGSWSYNWTYHYDALGRFSSMDSPAGTSQAQYTAGGNLLQTTLPNGLASRFGFKFYANDGSNYHGAVAAMVNYGVGSSGLNSTFGGMNYNDQNALGSVTATDYTGAGLSGTQIFGYNTPTNGDPYKLTSETNRLGASFSHLYDSGLNPTTLRGVTQPSPYSADDRPTGTGAPAYDADGNYNANGVFHDAENRLYKATAATFSAGYRADGLRAWKQANGSRTYFLYDQGGEPEVELNGMGLPSAINVFDPEGLVARVDVATSTGKYYQFDPQGNVSHTLSASGAVLDTRAYDAYGKELAVRNALGLPVMATDPFGFNARSGYYFDRELGTYYCQNRTYDPGTARWLERDPIGFDGGINQYSYCGASPVGNVDPEGLMIRISDDYTAAEKKAVRYWLEQLKNADCSTRQLIYSLINDKADHLIAPPRTDPLVDPDGTVHKTGGPHEDPDQDWVRFDPFHGKAGKGKGPHGTDAPASPDIILIHQLGHLHGDRRLAPRDARRAARPRPPVDARGAGTRVEADRAREDRRDVAHELRGAFPRRRRRRAAHVPRGMADAPRPPGPSRRQLLRLLARGVARLCERERILERVQADHGLSAAHVPDRGPGGVRLQLAAAGHASSASDATRRSWSRVAPSAAWIARP